MPSKFTDPGLGRGFRSRLAQVVLIALLPALLIALIWAWREDMAIRLARFDTAGQETGLDASRLNGWLESTYFSAVMLASILDDGTPSPSSCREIAPALPDLTVSIVVGDSTLCSVENGAESLAHQQPAGPSVAAILRPTQHGASANFWDGGLSVDLKTPGAQLVLNWSQHTLDELIGIGRPGIERATIADRSGRIVVERARHAERVPMLTITRPIGQTGLALTAQFPMSQYGPRPNAWFWSMELSIIAFAVLISFTSVRMVYRTVGSWVTYFRRIVVLLSGGRLSVRARRLDRAATEIAQLGGAINAMADNVAQRASNLEKSIVERDDLLRELQHRVKNNFQIIGHLIDLYKKTVPPARAAQLRFIEDHVQSMALVYRSAYRSEDNIHLSPIEIARSVITVLCDNAGITNLQVTVDSEDATVSIDRATGLSLSLAYSLPPYLEAHRDCAASQGMEPAPLNVIVCIIKQALIIEIDGLPSTGAVRLTFQERIAASYVSQLRASLTVPEGTASVYRLEMPLEDNFEINTANQD